MPAAGNTHPDANHCNSLVGPCRSSGRARIAKHEIAVFGGDKLTNLEQKGLSIEKKSREEVRTKGNKIGMRG